MAGGAAWRLAGAMLAMVGLATFWGVVVAGQNIADDLLRRLGVPAGEAASRAKIAFGFVQTWESVYPNAKSSWPTRRCVT